MAVKERAIIDGTLVGLNVRNGNRTSDGSPYTIRTAIIIGEHSLVEARVGDELVKTLPAVGQPIYGRVSFGTYRDEVQTDLEEIFTADAPK